MEDGLASEKQRASRSAWAARLFFGHGWPTYLHHGSGAGSATVAAMASAARLTFEHGCLTYLH